VVVTRDAVIRIRHYGDGEPFGRNI
jgi:hypothetical protein